jgi:hypothetical protein
VLSREFFHQLEDEVTRARYEIDEKYHIGLAEVKARLAHIAGIENLKVEPTPRGDEIYILGDVTAIVQKGNNRNTMNYLAEKLSNPFETEQTAMSITGAANLAGTIKNRIDAAKQRIAQVSANTDGALAKLNDAADTGDKIAKQIETEADDLLAQIGQFSNGGPA